MHQLEKGRPHSANVERRNRQQRTDWMRTALKRSAPFAALDDASFEALLGVCSPARFPRRGLLYEQGSVADSLYVVASGRVRVVRAAAKAAR